MDVSFAKIDEVLIVYTYVSIIVFGKKDVDPA